MIFVWEVDNKITFRKVEEFEKMDEIQRFKKSAKSEIDKFSALNFILLGENKKLEEKNKRLEKKSKRVESF